MFKLFRTIALTGLLSVTCVGAHAGPALDEPGAVLTVMQFTARSDADIGQLRELMREMRDYQRTLPGHIDNAVFENRNPQQQPHFVGVARWASLKQWEVLWASDRFQDIVRRLGRSGTLTPGIFAPVQ